MNSAVLVKTDHTGDTYRDSLPGVRSVIEPWNLEYWSQLTRRQCFACAELELAILFMKPCPSCQSTEVRASTKLTFVDALVYLLFLRAFHCRSCYRRYYAASWS